MKARKTNASKANSSGTSGGGGQNPVVTPTKPPSRDHLLSRDCWCQPEVDGNGPDGLPLEVQIEHQSSVYNGDVETFGTESEWTIKSGSILASLIELQDRRAAGQVNAEGHVDFLQLPPLNEVMYHAVRGLELDFGSGESLFQGSIDDDTLDLIWESINTALRCAKFPAPSAPNAEPPLTVRVPVEERRKALRVEPINDGIVITLPATAFKMAAELHPDLWDHAADASSLKIIDQNAFAKDVVRELRREEEDGTTLVHLMFDSAVMRALENGCEGIDHDAMLRAAQESGHE